MVELPTRVLEAMFELPEIDVPLIHIYIEIKENPTVSDELKQALWKEIIRTTPKKLTNTIRDNLIYHEYLTERAKDRPRLPIRTGKGGLYEAMSTPFNIGDKAIESIVNRMKKSEKNE